MPKRNFLVFGLILLAGFLILPGRISAIEPDDINLREIGKQLVLPESTVQKLIYSLIRIFSSEGQILFASPDPTTEEEAVPVVMKEVVRLQALNHLLTDAPFQVTLGIVKNAVKIASLIGMQNISEIVSELEKESVKKATEYGMNFLLENEIRATPGAIEFRYIAQDGRNKEVLFQYIIIYQPSGANRGTILVRFYSPNYLEPPENRGDPWGSTGIYIEHTTNIRPFIVDIRGNVEDFKWVGNPSVDIDFPPSVPDLGIRPLTFLQRNVLKPIIAKINDVEVIITKVVGEEPTKIVGNLTDNLQGIVSNVWNAIKSRVLQQVNLPDGAGVGQKVLEVVPRTEEERAEIVQRANVPRSDLGTAEEVGQEQEFDESFEEEIDGPEPPTLAELQRQVDEAARMVEALNLQVLALVDARNEKAEEVEDEYEEEFEELVDEKKDVKTAEIAICPVNVNTASAEELQAITGVGPVISQRIIDARPFASVNELEPKVKGIGPATLQKIINQGCAFAAGFIASGGGGGSGAVSVEPAEKEHEEEQEEQDSQEEESEPAKNLLANEFFEEWINPPKNWEYSTSTRLEIYQSAKVLRGEYSLGARHDLVGPRDIEQYINHNEADGAAVTYYGELRVRGSGWIRIGIRRPGYAAYVHNNWVRLEEADWTKLELVTTKDNRAGTDLGFRIRTSVKKQIEGAGNIDVDLHIGAAWLGTAQPPATWPMGEPPNKVTDFTIDTQNSYANKARLTWATSTDPDTASEDLSYKIYYSKAGELTESNLDDVSTKTATTTETALTLTGLEYNSVYYFSIKALDPENNSSTLATTTPYQTATLSVIADGVPPNSGTGGTIANTANNGRKIVRTSGGKFYAVYEHQGNILLAESANKGITWSELSVTDDGDQKNPSLAVDSQDNLHIAWQGYVGTSTVYKIRYAKYDGNSFSGETDFTVNEEQRQEIPVVAVDSQNKIHLGWVGIRSNGDSLYYVNNSGGNWGTIQTIKAGEFLSNLGKSLLTQFSLAPDSEGVLHFVWFEKPPNASRGLRYRKIDPQLSSENWPNFEQITTVTSLAYSSLVVDSQNNAHLVWHHWSSSGDPKVNYTKYTGSWSAIETLNEDNANLIVSCCSIGADQSDVLYVVWKTPRSSQPRPISQREYKDGAWQDVKELVAPFSSQGYPNLLWSIKNRPKTGYAFVFYEDTELKFYGSNDLTWE